jgi:oxygen-independent coproporphyrinogen-3 oxidase
MAHGLYLHVPFCLSICSYCNFNRGLFDAGVAEQYVDALATEIARSAAGLAADTIFFGGGTPSILEPAAIDRLVRACRDAFDVTGDAEITLETNPETVSEERMAGWRAAGINRISLGAQSFNAEELRRLERVHPVGKIAEAVSAARCAGFTNVSLDLMVWLPGQSRSSVLDSVERAIDLGPEHLSVYLLELYPNAPLADAMARVTSTQAASASEAAAWVQAAEDEAADMYLEGFDRLDRAGYRQYEISNTARPGAESRHNLKYWTAGSWIGFGCGAHSTAGGYRWRNVSSTTEYIRRIEAGGEAGEGRQPLGQAARAEEALFTGLRLAEGIDRAEFVARHGFDPWERHGADLAGPLADGLMWQNEQAFGLTRRGMLVSNEIVQLVI